MPLRLHKLNLSHFRNYETLRISPEGAPMVVLTGRNGSGKTNVLEAVSLLAPGQGLRGALLSEMQSRTETESPWAISAEIETPQGIVLRLGTGLIRNETEGSARRVVRINGRDVKSQAELSGVVSAVWLTPQMDRLFIEGAAPRRRFLDRLAYAFDPDHALRVSRAEKTTRERMRLLQADRPADPRWIASLESQMAADYTAIAAARLLLVQRLQAHAAALKSRQSLFPAPRMAVLGAAESLLQKGGPALAVEDEIKAQLAKDRPLDAAAGRTALSVLRSDLDVIYDDKNMPAAQCSTGEQKGLLIAIVLAHAQMMKAEKGYVPLLLLDEVAAHLDEARRLQLFSFLHEVEAQVWLTGTDEAVFAPLKDRARFFSVSDGQLFPQRELKAV
jgi:DNA replication and repair protein RecF